MSGEQKTPPQLLAIIAEQADRIAWLEGDVAQWRIKNQKLRDALRRISQTRPTSTLEPVGGYAGRVTTIAREAL